MLLSTTVNTTINEHFWALTAQGISGGGDTVGTVQMNTVLPTKAYADMIIVDGVSGLVTRAAHDIHWLMAVHAIAQSNPATTIRHNLFGRDPPLAMTSDSWSMSSLNILTDLKAGYTFLEITVNALAIGDTITVTAWGHYVPVGVIPEPTPVSVQEFHLFKPRKVSGPV